MDNGEVIAGSRRYKDAVVAIRAGCPFTGVHQCYAGDIASTFVNAVDVLSGDCVRYPSRRDWA